MNIKYVTLTGVILSSLFLAACQPKTQSLPESSMEQPPAATPVDDVVELKGTGGYMPGEKELYATPKPVASSSSSLSEPTPTPAQ